MAEKVCATLLLKFKLNIYGARFIIWIYDACLFRMGFLVNMIPIQVGVKTYVHR